MSSGDKLATSNGALLLEACKNGNRGVAFDMINRHHRSQFRDIDIGYIDEHQNTSLIWCIKNNYRRLSMLLIDSGKARTDHIDGSGYTPLMLAVSLGMFGVVCDLLYSGKTLICQTEHKYGNTALMISAISGNLRIMEQLLFTTECDVERTNNNNQTAFLLACKHGNGYRAKLLRTKMSEKSIACIDIYGQTAMDYIAEDGRVFDILCSNDYTMFSYLTNPHVVEFEDACSKNDSDTALALLKCHGMTMFDGRSDLVKKHTQKIPGYGAALRNIGGTMVKAEKHAIKNKMVSVLEEILKIKIQILVDDYPKFNN